MYSAVSVLADRPVAAAATIARLEQDSPDGRAVAAPGVRRARQGLARTGHVEVGDTKIGELLVRVPAADGELWPPIVVCELLEEMQSDNLDDGMYLGVVNGRGVTTRFPGDGGEQEMALVTKYEAAVRKPVAHFRATRVLRRLVGHYRDLARREDERRDLGDFQ